MGDQNVCLIFPRSTALFPSSKASENLCTLDKRCGTKKWDDRGEKKKNAPACMRALFFQVNAHEYSIDFCYIIKIER